MSQPYEQEYGEHPDIYVLRSLRFLLIAIQTGYLFQCILAIPLGIILQLYIETEWIRVQRELNIPDVFEVTDGVVVEVDECQHLTGTVPGVAGQVEFHTRTATGQAHVTNAGQIVTCQA